MIKRKTTTGAKTYEHVIERVDFTIERLDSTYESTEFQACTFGEVSGIAFTDCLFTACNLSNAQVAKCKAMDLTFRDCKLIGINFYQMLDFGFSLQFENCLMDYASFDGKKMNKSSFSNCRLHGANFSNADLSKASMTGCDLADAVFSGTNLSGMDFTTNRNFSIDPQLNMVRKTRFSANSLAGLLTKFDIVIE
ncbi:pentapeptide repeat-containing protein [Pedobacter frigoris]|uniref:Pentapeptide repeat-containing protein n=1 Tax=Pedobacter frigoris TaxID=2571272 RepID=A0A4U1CDR8_9SPHI|nr:pentapeptide repeat-containing protein [Pedobacter frigoris]TKC04278.1 pentapeptide repeat-containing protein [Pedobacter frigoris]